MPQSKHKQLEKQQHSGLQKQNNGHHNTTDSRIDSGGYKYASAGQPAKRRKCELRNATDGSQINRIERDVLGAKWKGGVAAIEMPKT